MPRKEARPETVRIGYLDGVDVSLASGVLLDEARPSFLLGREGAHHLGPLLRQPLHAQASDLPSHAQSVTAKKKNKKRRGAKARRLVGTSFSGAHSTSLHSESSCGGGAGDEEALQDTVKSLLLLPMLAAMPPPRRTVAC
jgi:hypothetical protein